MHLKLMSRILELNVFISTLAVSQSSLWWQVTTPPKQSIKHVVSPRAPAHHHADWLVAARLRMKNMTMAGNKILSLRWICRVNKGKEKLTYENPWWHSNRQHVVGGCSRNSWSRRRWRLSCGHEHWMEKSKHEMQHERELYMIMPGMVDYNLC